MQSFFPRDVLDEILNLIESVSEEVRSRLRDFWFSQDDPTGHSKRSEEDEERIDRRRRGKAIFKNGQKLTMPAQLGQLKTRRVGKGLLQSPLWFADDLPRL